MKNPPKKPAPKKVAVKKPAVNKTEAMMREKWKNMPKESEFKRDSTDMRNSLVEYGIYRKQNPKLASRPDVAAFSSDKKKKEAGLRAMKASLTFDKVVNKRKGDVGFYDKMKLNPKIRKEIQ